MANIDSDLTRWILTLAPAVIIFTIMFALCLLDKRRLATSTAVPAWRDGFDSELISIQGFEPLNSAEASGDEIPRESGERDALLGRYGSPTSKANSPRVCGSDASLGKFPKTTFEHFKRATSNSSLRERLLAQYPDLSSP